MRTKPIAICIAAAMAMFNFTQLTRLPQRSRPTAICWPRLKSWAKELKTLYTPEELKELKLADLEDQVFHYQQDWVSLLNAWTLHSSWDFHRDLSRIGGGELRKQAGSQYVWDLYSNRNLWLIKNGRITTILVWSVSVISVLTEISLHALTASLHTTVFFSLSNRLGLWNLTASFAVVLRGSIYVTAILLQLSHVDVQTVCRPTKICLSSKAIVFPLWYARYSKWWMISYHACSIKISNMQQVNSLLLVSEVTIWG